MSFLTTRDVAFPVGTKVIHIPEVLTTMEAEVPQPYTVRRCTTATVLPTVDRETVEMLIAPGKQDL